MSDLPVVQGADAPVQARGSAEVVETLRRALVAVDEQRQELVAAGDWEALAVGLDGISALIGDMQTIKKSLVADVADTIPEKRMEVEGFGSIEVRRGKVRKGWESKDLLARLVQIALVDADTGEVESDPVAVRERLLEVLGAAVPFTGSMGWRVGALKEYGLDPDEWCEVAGYTTSVQIRRAES